MDALLKIFADREKENKALDDRYISPIPQGLRWRDWASNDEGITGDVLLDFIDNRLIPGLKALKPCPGDDPRGFIIKEFFQDVSNYMKSGGIIPCRGISNIMRIKIWWTSWLPTRLSRGLRTPELNSIYPTR